VTRDGEAYGVPVPFVYDCDRLSLYLFQFGGESKKLGYSVHTRRACLTVIDVESRTEWRSVIVTGTLHELSDAEIEHAEAVIDDRSSRFSRIFWVGIGIISTLFAVIAYLITEGRPLL
jgi:nitroimidazol reductase NimA-like FMN-containing flavoprotein (pyridoxamine 5'-phosphate oxidase superfamily)